jgi:hypothetical protein
MIAVAEHCSRAQALGVDQFDHRQRVEHVALEDLQAGCRKVVGGELSAVLLGVVGDQQQRLSALARGGQEAFGDGRMHDMAEDHDGPLLSAVVLHGESPEGSRLPPEP